MSIRRGVMCGWVSDVTGHPQAGAGAGARQLRPLCRDTASAFLVWLSPARHVRYGVNMFITEWGIRPDELGRALEDRGFESLWVAEHTHIPASLESSRRQGRTLGREYWSSYDPFVSLATAAAVTERLVVATGILLLVERDPIVTAKEIATLDRLSGGRVAVGVGAGWNREEMAHHGTDFATRFDLVRERILAMRALWTQDEAEYHGTFVDFSPSLAFPKPLQAPGPPILLGGTSRRALRCVVAACDGWMPYSAPADWPRLKEQIEELRRMAEEVGRDPASIRLTMCLRSAPGPALIEELEAAGVERVVLDLLALDRDGTLRALDAHAHLTG